MDPEEAEVGRHSQTGRGLLLVIDASSERVRLEAELARQSSDLKSALLASLGHDLKTPLTAIRVAAANLQTALPGVDFGFGLARFEDYGGSGGGFPPLWAPDGVGVSGGGAGRGGGAGG